MFLDIDGTFYNLDQIGTIKVRSGGHHGTPLKLAITDIKDNLITNGTSNQTLTELRRTLGRVVPANGEETGLIIAVQEQADRPPQNSDIIRYLVPIVAWSIASDEVTPMPLIPTWIPTNGRLFILSPDGHVLDQIEEVIYDSVEDAENAMFDAAMRNYQRKPSH